MTELLQCIVCSLTWSGCDTCPRCQLDTVMKSRMVPTVFPREELDETTLRGIVAMADDVEHYIACHADTRAEFMRQLAKAVVQLDALPTAENIRFKMIEWLRSPATYRGSLTYELIPGMTAAADAFERGDDLLPYPGRKESDI